MKKLFSLFLILILFAGVANASAAEKATVAVLVSGDFGDEIRNNIVQALSKRTDIAIVDSSGDYTVSVVSNQVRWPGGRTSGIVPISCVVLTSKGSGGHWLVIGDSLDLSIACDKIIGLVNSKIPKGS